MAFISRKTTTPFDIGWKALAVNLSDLAAMGATPTWVTLALTLPEADTAWLNAFSDGFFTLAEQYNIALIGGDLTRGPLSITIQAMGFCEKKMAIQRAGAKPGDLICVSNTLGDAALGLECSRKKQNSPHEKQTLVLAKTYRPIPQINLGQQLIGLASSALIFQMDSPPTCNIF